MKIIFIVLFLSLSFVSCKTTKIYSIPTKDSRGEKGASIPGCNIKNYGEYIKKKSGHSCNLTNANLRGADLPGVNLSSANLEKADLRSAKLSGAQLRSANLKGANFSYADLERADLRGVNLRGADLTGTNLYQANLQLVNFTNTKIDSALATYLTSQNISGFVVVE